MTTRKDKRPFLVLDETLSATTKVLRSASPRGAALKATARGMKNIALFDPAKGCIWHFRGQTLPRERAIVDLPAWASRENYQPKKLKVESQGKTPVDDATAATLLSALSALTTTSPKTQDRTPGESDE